MSHFTSKAAKTFLCAALAAASMASTVFAGEMSVGMGKTTGNSLRIREYPTTDCGVVANLDRGTTLAIIDGSEEGWYHVAYAGKTGWVASEYVARLANGEFSAPGKVTRDGAGVYESPSETSPMKETIAEGASVTVNALYDGWYLVKCQYGTEGYIRSEYVDLIGATASGSTNASGSAIVSAALRYKGYRYVYGAAGPNSFDCSGFTMFIMKKFGVSLPHSATQQWQSSKGTRVYRISNLQPGDLVYFRWSGSRTACSHTGIYIGNNQIIHASSSRTGVIVTNLTGKYVSCFVGGKHFTT